MNYGRITNSPLPSVRILATHRLIPVVFRKCAVHPTRVLLIVLLSLAVTNGEPTQGRADDEDDEVVLMLAARRFMFTEKQFDQMVFGSQLSAKRVQVAQKANGVQAVQVVQESVALSLTDFRKRMEALAATEIDVVDRRVSLTDAQKKKLKLAARGDTEQHISRANELRPKLTSEPLDQSRYTELMRELQPLQMARQFGLVGEASLFRKTLRHCLTDEQHAHWQIVERERKTAAVESTIQNLDRQKGGIRLWGEIRQKFIDVLVEHGDLPDTRSSYIHHVVLVEVGKLEDHLKPLVSDEDWGKLQKQIAQARQVEAALRRSGAWPVRAVDDDVADSKIDAAKGR